MPELKVAVVILNFNGRFFLENFLPGIIRNSKPHPVIVADNASTDDSVPFMREKFPQVQLILNKENFGYAKGYNEALRQISSEYFVLLNSDVEVSEGWLDPMIALLERDRSIAACQPKILDHADPSVFEYAGASGGFIDRLGYPFCRGRVFNSLEKDTGQFNDTREVFWASGASLFVRSTSFYACGGLDDDYFAHMEEIDLCWRMKNMGHKILVVPSSVIYHIGGGTLNKYSSRKTYLNFRNNITTLTKNHPPPGLVLKILFRLLLDGIAGIKFLFEGQPKHFAAVIRAHFSYYRQLPLILRKRKNQQKIPGFRYNLSGMYAGNVVFEYFLKGKKTFTDLLKGFYQ